jgi:Na+/H+ antiporter NhaD/arsenite permease-like protein
MEITFTPSPEAIIMIAGVVLSVLFSYVPGFANWYNTIEDEVTKQLIMLGLLIVVTAAVFALACGGMIQGVVCTKPGLIQLIWALILAVIANQSTDRISPNVGLKARKF